MIRDENSGLLEKPVQLARKNLRVLLEGENLEGNTVM
jgi:type VI secretion system protein ImpJ